MVEDDFTCNVVLHRDDLILFYKRKFNEPTFTNLNLKEPQKKKKKNHFHVVVSLSSF